MSDGTSYAASHSLEEHYFLRIGDDCFDNAEDAILAANKMRAAKLKSLEKQIAKVEKLDFHKQIADIQTQEMQR